MATEQDYTYSMTQQDKDGWRCLGQKLKRFSRALSVINQKAKWQQLYVL